MSDALTEGPAPAHALAGRYVIMCRDRVEGAMGWR
jgi:hypothetical protein